GISAINPGQAIAAVGRWIAEGRKTYVCVCNVHTVMECRADEEMRQAVNRAGLSTPDGMPLVWLTKAAGFPNVARVYGPDLMLQVLALAEEKGWSSFFYGA